MDARIHTLKSVSLNGNHLVDSPRRKQEMCVKCNGTGKIQGSRTTLMEFFAGCDTTVSVREIIKQWRATGDHPCYRCYGEGFLLL